MKKFQKIAFLLVFSVFTTGSLGLFAQTPLGYGAKNNAIAGSGVALSSEALWGNKNPGGLAFLGRKIGLGIDIQMPTVSYKVLNAPASFNQDYLQPWPLGLQEGQADASRKATILPNIGINLELNDNSSLAISIFSNGRRGHSFDTKTYYSPIIAEFPNTDEFTNPMGVVSSPTFFHLSQYFSAISYSYKINDKIGVGLSAVGAWQSLNVGGYEAFGSLGYSAYPQEISNNDMANAYGLGGQLGLQWNISKMFQLGLTYRSELFMSSFESYKGLIAENGQMNIPAEWSLGIALQASENLLIAIDAQRICYSQVAAWNLPMASHKEGYLGGDNGSGLGREDEMRFKMGLQYHIPKWDFKIGYAYIKPSIVSDEVLLNMLMPDIIQNHISLGVSRMLNDEVLHFALIKGLKSSMTGVNALDLTQEIELEAESWTLAFSVDF
ncbi:MAG: hypothetical protein B7C24_10725 [Bacteroidetes bacterium 4572_77]|nr:MAG: hypothetical protein B7C24_10725 [Bacteroidetes bacterium 4572_77]